jgi:hypothetical protein
MHTVELPDTSTFRVSPGCVSSFYWMYSSRQATVIRSRSKKSVGSETWCAIAAK